MAGYVPIGQTISDPWAGWGDEMRRRDAYAQSANAIARGDAAGARNALLAKGFGNEAQQVQQIYDADQQNTRANAAEGRTAAAQNLAKQSGSLAADGDIDAAKAAALKGGNVDLATSFANYDTASGQAAADAAKRTAVAQAADLVKRGNLDGAKALLMPHMSADDLMKEVSTSAQDSVKKAGQLAMAYKDDPELWDREGLPALKRLGIDPQGYEGQAGINALMAQR